MREESQNLQKKDSELPTDVVQQFLDNQKSEIEIRRQEINLASKQDDNQKEVALQSIKAQQEDFKDDRNVKYKSGIANKIFTLIILAIGIAFIIFAFIYNKDEIAIEVIRIAGTAIISAGGGYYYGKSSAQSSH